MAAVLGFLSCLFTSEPTGSLPRQPSRAEEEMYRLY